MSIRLNKAIRELNIGMQTAVEFLEKRKDLGEVPKDNANFKLNDAQYNALVEAFKHEADVKSQAEKIFPKKQKEKKRAAVSEDTRGEDLLQTTNQQKFTPLGKIDLDGVEKKTSSKKSVAQTEKTDSNSKATAESQEKQPAVEKEVKPKSEAKAHAKEHSKESHKTHKEAKAPVAAVEAEAKKPAAEAPKAVISEAPKAKEEDKKVETEDKKDDIFQLNSEKKILNGPNVLGKIDLATLNQSTRPKKKTKEERKKEREEKAQQQAGERKKRVRINKERVDINAEVSQNTNRNRNNNNTPNNNAGNKNKKKKNKPVKPVEVNDEDVARQVKEDRKSVV